MNKVILIGRLTKDPEVSYVNGSNGNSIPTAKFTLAVDRRTKKDDPNAQNADFIRCVCWNKLAEVCEQYWHKGMKAAVTGRIQTGKYTNKDGQTVFTTDVIVEELEFAESKNASGGQAATTGNGGYNGGYQNTGYQNNRPAQQNNGGGFTGGYQNGNGYSGGYGNQAQAQPPQNFINIPEGTNQELPFN